jgi:tellurium resistance protein TerD
VIAALTRGGNVSLSKMSDGLRRISVGLGWDARAGGGVDVDIDASAILLGVSGKAVSDRHFVFFNNSQSPDEAVAHLTEDPTGEGDDEAITVDLSRVGSDVERIVFVASIYEGAERGQTFARVNNAFIRVIDVDRRVELARYDHADEDTAVTALLFGEVYRHRGEWKFRAVGQGWANGLAGVAREYGVNV